MGPQPTARVRGIAPAPAGSPGLAVRHARRLVVPLGTRAGGEGGRDPDLAVLSTGQPGLERRGWQAELDSSSASLPLGLDLIGSLQARSPVFRDSGHLEVEPGGGARKTLGQGAARSRATDTTPATGGDRGRAVAPPEERPHAP